MTFVVDHARKEIRVGTRAIRARGPKVRALADALLAARPDCATQKDLRARLHGARASDASPSCLRVYVGRLRTLLRYSGWTVAVEPGRGYRLVSPADRRAAAADAVGRAA